MEASDEASPRRLGDSRTVPEERVDPFLLLVHPLEAPGEPPYIPSKPPASPRTSARSPRRAPVHLRAAPAGPRTSARSPRRAPVHLRAALVRPPDICAQPSYVPRTSARSPRRYPRCRRGPPLRDRDQAHGVDEVVGDGRPGCRAWTSSTPGPRPWTPFLTQTSPAQLPGLRVRPSRRSSRPGDMYFHGQRSPGPGAPTYQKDFAPPCTGPVQRPSGAWAARTPPRTSTRSMSGGVVRGFESAAVARREPPARPSTSRSTAPNYLLGVHLAGDRLRRGRWSRLRGGSGGDQEGPRTRRSRTSSTRRSPGTPSWASPWSPWPWSGPQGPLAQVPRPARGPS